MDTRKNRLQVVKSRIEAASRACGRDARDIVLVAVSKGHDAAAIRAAFALGQRDFGESYVQEALDKMATLTDLPIVWHFIGPLQGNKTRAVAEHFDWVHSVDRIRIAARLAAQRPAALSAQNVCLQVNISGETSKHGVAPQALPELAQGVAQLSRLRLRGLMAIPEPTDDTERARTRFLALAQLRDALNREGHALDTLSMGMSDDFEAAIEAGSTMVRVGTAIFGPRASAAAGDFALNEHE